MYTLLTFIFILICNNYFIFIFCYIFVFVSLICTLKSKVSSGKIINYLLESTNSNLRTEINVARHISFRQRNTTATLPSIDQNKFLLTWSIHDKLVALYFPVFIIYLSNSVANYTSSRHFTQLYQPIETLCRVHLVFLNMEIFIVSDENGSVADSISDRPIEISEFMKLCEQRRKFPVLYKLEFEVCDVILRTNVKKIIAFPYSILKKNILKRNH